MRLHRTRDEILTFFAGFVVASSGAMIAYQFTIPHGLRYQQTTTEVSTMPKTATPKPVPLNEQIAVIKRRLMQMENTYPRYVKEHRMTQEKADKDLDRFRAALDTLIRVKLIQTSPMAQDQLPLGTYTEPAAYHVGGTDAKN